MLGAQLLCDNGVMSLSLLLVSTGDKKGSSGIFTSVLLVLEDKCTTVINCCCCCCCCCGHVAAVAHSSDTSGLILKAGSFHC